MATMESMPVPRQRRNFIITLGITHVPFGHSESIEVLMQGYGIWDAVDVVLAKTKLDFPDAHKIVVTGHRDATAEYPIEIYTAEVIDRGFLDSPPEQTYTASPPLTAEQRKTLRPSDLAVSIVGKVIVDRAVESASQFIVSRRKES